MKKKTYTFGLLAAVLILAPSAAFAGEQDTFQEINQDAAAIGHGSRVNQRANQNSIQTQTRQGSFYGRGCSRDYQSQRSGQIINQSGVAVDNSHVEQKANQDNFQRQVIRASRFCN